jgi:uncharacterized membrane protein YadS
MLLPVVLAIGLVVARSGAAGGGSARVGLPAFLIGFVALMLVNSVGLIPEPAVAAISDVSRWCLVTAIAALGMKTSFKTLFGVGWRPVGLMVVETVWIGGLVLAAVMLVA